MSPTPPADRLIARFLRQGTKSFGTRGYTWKTWSERTKGLGLWQLNTFHAWATAKGLALVEVTEDDLDDFVSNLEYRPEADGGPWSPSAVQGVVQTLRRFYAWTDLEGDTQANPARRLRTSRRVEENGPDVKQVHLTEAEHRAMLAACPLKAKGNRGRLAARDAAVLTVFWATGVRRAELARFDLDDVDHDTGVVKVSHVKGGGAGVGLLDDEALEAVDRYLDRRRFQLDGVPALFVTHQQGIPPRRLGLEAISATVRDAAARARLPRVVACHEYRRSFLTGEAASGASTQDLEILGGYRPGSRMPRRYMGKAAEGVALENLKRRRADAAERSRKRRQA